MSIKDGETFVQLEVGVWVGRHLDLYDIICEPYKMIRLNSVWYGLAELLILLLVVKDQMIS